MLFPWYDVADLVPALDRDHPPVGTMQDPWLHIDQGWFFMALEDDGEVIVAERRRPSWPRAAERVSAFRRRASALAWAGGYERVLDL